MSLVVRRLLAGIPVVLLASVVVFFGVSTAGDPLALLRLQPQVSDDTLRAITERKHLDEPLAVQYRHWVAEAAAGRFGTDLGGRPIWPDLRRALGNTLQLIVAAELLSLLVALPLGMLAARRQYSVVDHATTAVSLLGFSVPLFWFALTLQVLVTNLYVATGVRLFYTAGLSSPGAGTGLAFVVDRLQHLALPIVCIAFVNVALYSRYLRASMLDVLHADHLRTARAKGLAEGRVLRRHALRAALIPVVAVVAVNFGASFGGALVTEAIFAIDGMGAFFIRALTDRDVYRVMAFLMVTSVVVVLANLAADLVHGWLDPRVRHG